MGGGRTHDFKGEATVVGSTFAWAGGVLEPLAIRLQVTLQPPKSEPYNYGESKVMQNGLNFWGRAQTLDELQSKLLKGGYIGEYSRGY